MKHLLKLSLLLLACLLCVGALAQNDPRTQVPPHMLEDAPGEGYLLRSNTQGEFEQVLTPPTDVRTDGTLTGSGARGNQLRVDTVVVSTVARLLDSLESLDIRNRPYTEVIVVVGVHAPPGSYVLTVPGADTARQLLINRNIANYTEGIHYTRQGAQITFLDYELETDEIITAYLR